MFAGHAGMTTARLELLNQRRISLSSENKLLASHCRCCYTMLPRLRPLIIQDTQVYACMCNYADLLSLCFCAYSVDSILCRFKPYWVPVAAMYNATASSNGLNQGGHRGLARVTAMPGSATLASPPEYEAESFRTESDDTHSVQSDATYDGDGSGPTSKPTRGGAVAAVLLAFCAGAIVGALAYRGHERRTVADAYGSELVPQSEHTHELLQQQSSVSRGQQTPR